MPRAFWAPGRVNFIGEFTDLVDGLVLPAALDLGIRITGEAADSIELRSTSETEMVRLGPEGSGEARGWGRYVAAVAQELALLGRPAVGFRGELESTLPIGAGLSSSAALEVGVATALCAVAEFDVGPLDLARAAQRAENSLGIPSGILDQAACVLGRAGHAVLLDTGTLEHELVPLPPELAIVIVDSGVRRTVEHSGYSQRQRELERGDPRRVRHVETENERVHAVADAFRANDLLRLGAIFREGHESLRVDFEVTTPELDRLVELAYAHGAVAARMTGGGFGGAIVALVHEAEVSAFAADIGERAWICRASDGARELVREGTTLAAGVVRGSNAPAVGSDGVFTAEERERVRERVFELARADERVTGGALTGSFTVGAQDEWSDVDTAFGIAEGADPDAVLAEWTERLDEEFHFVHQFDLRRGATVYRVYLLPNTLELDISLTPASQFRAYGPNFQLVFGEAAETAPATRPSAEELIGWAWIYALNVRAAVARGKLWQAAHYVEEVRNHGLALACLRHGLPTAYARGVHRLDAADTDPWLQTLVRELEPEELRRALGVAVDALLREIAATDSKLAERLREPLRTLTDGA